MSVAPLDPAGIDAHGNGSVWFVPTIADPEAPTAAEINAGVNLSCALYGFNPSLSFATGGTTRRKYCAKRQAQDSGDPQYSIEAIEYDYDPQDPSSVDYAYYAQLEPGTVGFIVDRRGIDAKEEPDVASGEYVDIYPVRLRERVRVAIDPNATEAATLTTQQYIDVIGEVRYDVAVAA